MLWFMLSKHPVTSWISFPQSCAQIGEAPNAIEVEEQLKILNLQPDVRTSFGQLVGSLVGRCGEETC